MMQENELYYFIATIVVIASIACVCIFSLFKKIKDLSMKATNLKTEIEVLKNEIIVKNKEHKSTSLSLLSEIAHLVYIQRVANIALRSLAIKDRNQAQEAKLEEALKVCELVGNLFNQRHEKIIKSLSEKDHAQAKKDNS